MLIRTYLTLKKGKKARLIPRFLFCNEKIDENNRLSI